MLRRRKGTVILAGVAGALIGFLITLPQTPVYQARTTIEIVGLNDNFLNSKQITPLTETGTTSEAADLQTQSRILQSESLLRRVLEKLSHYPLPEPAGQNWLSFLRWLFHIPEWPAAAQPENALKRAVKGVKVRSTGMTRILEITADSTHPAAAADFANTLANEFILQNLEARWKTTERTSQSLTRQIGEMRVKLERSEAAMHSYARQTGLMFNGQRTSVAEEKLGQLQQTLSAAQAERMARQSRYEMASGSPPEALPDLLGEPSLRDYQTKLTELRRLMAELSAVYTPEHPKMMRAQAQVGTIESALERERDDVLRRIGREFEEAKRKEALIAGAYDAQARRVGAESESAIRYHILEREVESNRQLYDTLLQQLKQATVAAAMHASNVRVVDPATIPARPYKPDAMVSSGLGLLTGIFAAVAFVVMRERGDTSVQQPGEVPLYLNLPELGVIPSGGGGAAARQLARIRASLRASNGNRSGNRKTLEESVELITWQRKSSLMAESFRAVLMSILFAGENESLPKVMAVTSAGPAEGKSTVASNLAIAIAEIDRKILLIDADLRKPRLQQIFGLPSERGLSDILRERQTGSGALALDGLIRSTEVPGLFVLPSGRAASAATNLLYGSRMIELLKRLSVDFETILIDTPPMLQLPDARVIGRMADAVILVVRCGKTSRDAALAARQRFAEDGAEMLGAVLNGWNPMVTPNGHAGHYNASYHSFRKHYASRGAHA